MTVFQLLSDPTISHKTVLDKLMRHHLQVDQAGLIRAYDEELSDVLEQTLRQQVDEYVQYKKPLEYILGYCEFDGHRFIVSPATLIPRPETEYMIQAVSDWYNLHQHDLSVQKNLLVDIGTGCGVLGLSILMRHHRLIHQAICTEISSEALDIARQNIDIYADECGGTQIQCIQSNLVDVLVGGHVVDVSTFDNIMIVANLPYIPDQTFDDNVDETVRNREPRMAFVGGTDGLDYYREMIDTLQANKISPTMFLEMMTWQLDILRSEYAGRVQFDIHHTFHFNIVIVSGIFVI